MLAEARASIEMAERCSAFVAKLLARNPMTVDSERALALMVASWVITYGERCAADALILLGKEPRP